MTETELFVKMLDEDATNELLKIFSPSTKNGNVEFKKVQLRKVFKGLHGSSIKKKKKNINEFDIAINHFVNPTYKKRTKQELITMFSRDIHSNIPNYIKFANLYFYHTDIVKEKLNLMNENFESKSNLCKGMIEFKSIEDVEEELKSNMMFCTSIKEKVCNYIRANLSEEDRIKFEELKEIVSKWDLVEFYNNLIDFSEKYPIYLIQLQYLSLKENKVEIENGISIEMLLNYYNEVNVSKSNKNIEELEIIEKEFSQYKLEHEKLKNDYKLLNKKLERSEKKEAEIILENKQYKIDNKSYEVKNQKLINELNIKNLTIEEIKLQNEKYKCRLIEEEQKNTQLMIVVNEYKDIFEVYNQQASSIGNSSKKEYEFVIICKEENIICRMIYPEVLFINSSEWKNYFEEYKNEIIRINKLYIQRVALSNSERRKISKFSKENNIKLYTICGENEKEILETIIKIKNNIKI